MKKIAKRERLSAAARKAEVEARAGCVKLTYCRRGTGPMVGVYKSLEAGMEEDPSQPWSVVCEEHGAIVMNSVTLSKRELAAVMWSMYAMGNKTKVKMPNYPNGIKDTSPIPIACIIFDYAPKSQRLTFEKVAMQMMVKRRST